MLNLCGLLGRLFRDILLLIDLQEYKVLRKRLYSIVSMICCPAIRTLDCSFKMVRHICLIFSVAIIF
jgi:hypothetical protein